MAEIKRIAIPLYERICTAFDFSNLSIQEARESFSHECRKVVPHTIVDLTTLYFKANDGTHLLSSHQFEMAGAGNSKVIALGNLL